MMSTCALVSSRRSRTAFFTISLLALLLSLFDGPGAFLRPGGDGFISGVVRDPSGSVLPGATVTATNVATAAARTVQSGADGAYTIPT